MMWKAIGQSVAGTSHTATGKPCEDAVRYAILKDDNDHEVLVCCCSDGAGSAQHAAWASAYAADKVVACATHLLEHKEELTEAYIYAVAEDIYDGLLQEAKANDTELNEYSCTMLGCIITNEKAAFFQVGDGAIVRNDGNGFYTPVWWPHNGEYQNTTAFLVDDPTFRDLNVTIIEEQVNEVALFTDGLQMLILNMDSMTVHQPFFTDLFKFLYKAGDADKINVLNRKLAGYLDGTTINDRTDDDKTLFLATRLDQ